MFTSKFSCPAYCTMANFCPKINCVEFFDYGVSSVFNWYISFKWCPTHTYSYLQKEAAELSIKSNPQIMLHRYSRKWEHFDMGFKVNWLYQFDFTFHDCTERTHVWGNLQNFLFVALNFWWISLLFDN